jgi:hypothetical protein
VLSSSSRWTRPKSTRRTSTGQAGRVVLVRVCHGSYLSACQPALPVQSQPQPVLKRHNLLGDLTECEALVPGLCMLSHARRELCRVGAVCLRVCVAKCVLQGTGWILGKSRHHNRPIHAPRTRVAVVTLCCVHASGPHPPRMHPSGCIGRCVCELPWFISTCPRGGGCFKAPLRSSGCSATRTTHTTRTAVSHKHNTQWLHQ